MNRRWSIATGVALLVLAVVAGATQGLVFSGLDPDRPATFVDSGPALALAAVAFVTVVLLDVVIGWGLWRVLRDRAPRASGVAAALRIGYAGWLAVATIWLVRAAGAGAEGSAQAAAHYAVFDRQWQISLGLFGLHLLVLGFALWPRARIVAGLVALSGLGYAIDGLGHAISPAYAGDVAMFTFFGEVVLSLWLLIRGGRDAGALKH